MVRRRGDDAAGVAAAALYVLEVTRANAQWAAWAERDTAFVRWGRKPPACPDCALDTTARVQVRQPGDTAGDSAAAAAGMHPEFEL